MKIKELIQFFQNTGDKAKGAQAVTAPAFSLTKVLSAAAIVVAPIATVVVDKIGKLNLTEWQYVSLALGVLLFLAIAASADVLARAYATGQKARQQLAPGGHLLPFKEPVDAHIGGQAGEAPVAVDVVALSEGEEPYFLVLGKANGSKPGWRRASEVTFG